MFYYNLNTLNVSGESRLYNLSDDFIETFSVHIEPITFSANINGFNEVLASSLWLLESNNISITLDNNQTFTLNKNSIGRSCTYPIIYKRSGLAKKILSVSVSGSNTTIQPLFGNDSTTFGNDWIRLINSGKDSNLGIITSLPSSGSIIQNKQYFLNHFINTNENDYLSFSVNIIPSDQPTIDLITQQLLKCRFVVRKSIYNKQMTNGIELLYDNTFKSQPDDFGVRY